MDSRTLLYWFLFYFFYFSPGVTKKAKTKFPMIWFTTAWLLKKIPLHQAKR
jgi:hypothetical protein